MIDCPTSSRFSFIQSLPFSFNSFKICRFIGFLIKSFTGPTFVICPTSSCSTKAYARPAFNATANAISRGTPSFSMSARISPAPCCAHIEVERICPTTGMALRAIPFPIIGNICAVFLTNCSDQLSFLDCSAFSEETVSS